MVTLKELMNKYPTFDEDGSPSSHDPEVNAELKKPTAESSESPSTTQSKNRRGRSQTGSKTKATASTTTQPVGQTLPLSEDGDKTTETLPRSTSGH